MKNRMMGGQSGGERGGERAGKRGGELSGLAQARRRRLRPRRGEGAGTALKGRGTRGGAVGVWLVVLLWHASALAGAERMTLVADGVARAVIVVPPQTTAPLDAAVADLTHFIERMSGARLAIAGDDTLPEHLAAPDRPPVIWVGLRPEVAAAFPGVDLTLAHPEATLLVCNGRDLLIAGRDRVIAGVPVESGTVNAIYTFLQAHLGVRWFWPGELGEDWLEQPTIALAPFEARYHPQIRQRRLRMADHRAGFLYAHEKLQDKPQVPGIEAVLQAQDQAVAVWNRRQRLALGSFEMHAAHAFQQWWQRFETQHPDWFALQYDGGRGPNLTSTWTTDGKHIHLCLSNPQVADQWQRDVRRLLRQSPERRVFSASPNDSVRAGYCRCADCRAWDAPDGTPVMLQWDGLEEAHVSLTDRHVHFWNRLARGLSERHPQHDLMVGAWAYAAYREPPIDVALEPNVAVGFVTNLPAAGLAARDRDRAHWQAWAQKAQTLVWRPNLGHAGAGGGLWGLPLVYMTRTGEDFRFLAEHRIVGLDVDSVIHHWATQGVQYYLLAQLAWDPRQEAQATLADYYDRAFGAAAAEVRAYFDRFEAIQYQIFEQAVSRQEAAASLFPTLYSEQVFQEAYRLLDQAAAAVATAPQRYQQRVAFLRTGLDFAESQVQGMRAIQHWRATGQGLAQVQAANARKQQVGEASLGSFAIGYLQYLEHKQWRGMAPHLGPVAVAGEGASHDWRPLRAGVPAIPREASLRLRGEVTGLLYADAGERVELDLIAQPVGRSFTAPLTYAVLAPSGAVLREGQVAVGEEAAVHFQAAVSGVYRLVSSSGRNAFAYRGAGRVALMADRGLPLIGPQGALYFWVPPGQREVAVQVRGRAGVSVVKAALRDAQGRTVASEDGIAGQTHRLAVSLPQPSTGEVWQLVLGPASEGRLQDVRVWLGEGLPPLVAMHPDALLIPATDAATGFEGDAGDPTVQ